MGHNDSRQTNTMDLMRAAVMGAAAALTVSVLMDDKKRETLKNAARRLSEQGKGSLEPIVKKANDFVKGVEEEEESAQGGNGRKANRRSE